MNEEESILAEKARVFIKEHKDDLIARFANPKIFPPVDSPATIFMAGSPGAGKTEFSKRLIERFEQQFSVKIVRIDSDEIREMLPGYNGSNSYIFQGACALGIEKLHDSILSHQQNAVVDGTFVNYDKSADNIRRSLKKGRKVQIYYVYQDPLIAWDFTQKREDIEGRHIPKEAFIRAFIESKNTVRRIKDEFEGQVQIHLVMKNYQNNDENLLLNIKNLDQYIKKQYHEDELRHIIT